MNTDNYPVDPFTHFTPFNSETAVSSDSHLEILIKLKSAARSGSLFYARQLSKLKRMNLQNTALYKDYDLAKELMKDLWKFYRKTIEEYKAISEKRKQTITFVYSGPWPSNRPPIDQTTLQVSKLYYEMSRVFDVNESIFTLMRNAFQNTFSNRHMHLVTKVEEDGFSMRHFDCPDRQIRCHITR